MALQLLPPTFARWVIGRAVGTWVGVRAVIAALALAFHGSAGLSAQLPGTLRTREILLAVVVMLTIHGMARRNELLLFANLGVRRRTIVATALAGPLTLEIALGLLR
ncbi:MAG TPA: hypothetical protein PKA50_07305 [Gemmatimonadales bacterium]|nr:hypothetical protein [Gemmatimonadales bacterium]